MLCVTLWKISAWGMLSVLNKGGQHEPIQEKNIQKGKVHYIRLAKGATLVTTLYFVAVFRVDAERKISH